MILRNSAVVLAFTFLTTFRFACAGDAPDSSRQAKLDDGYSLLYKLMNDEKQVELILMVKTTPPKVGAFIKRISEQARDDVDLLDRFHTHDPHLRFDKVSLPQVELDVRASIRAEKQHNLLYGQTGDDFARYLLITQIEASSYASNLAKVLAATDPNAARVRALSKMAARWGTIRDGAYSQLKGF